LQQAVVQWTPCSGSTRIALLRTTKLNGITTARASLRVDASVPTGLHAARGWTKCDSSCAGCADDHLGANQVVVQPRSRFVSTTRVTHPAIVDGTAGLRRHRGSSLSAFPTAGNNVEGRDR
jgi:hypothetical protein